MSVTFQLLHTNVAGRRFTTEDIRFLHREWLGAIYPWAGKFRGVNVSKSGFTFAVARFIPELMAKFQQGPLKEFTPCEFDDVQQVAEALAVTHCELILIHPFREGNGRCARLLAQAMAQQSGYSGLDFSPMSDGGRYVSGIHASLAGNYSPMREIFREILTNKART